ncbi:DUF2971 domain-containing protein [Pseudaeromonas sharmana]|uniref:DUF2971 domain-containing protein n=1 Tax=Pseudaeromonas sharmana TaxID=328412 RepID=A0ABV8CLB2_9GAMM
MRQNPNRTLTRYISLTKLLAFLEHGLFIPKATLFDDELEGVLYYFGEKKPTNHIISRESIRSCMDWIYISCWHLDETESHAMWKIYGASSESVAIQTTEADFKYAYFSLKSNMHTYFDSVRYKNPTQDNIKELDSIFVLNNINTPTYENTATYAALLSFMKHSGFSFENEARLIAIDPNANSTSKNNSNGISISNIESQQMIKKILIHPYAPVWFEKLVIDILCNRYKLDIPVHRSVLVEDSASM